MTTSAENTKSLIKKKTIPVRTTIHTTSPSKETIESGSPMTHDVPQTPSNSPNGCETQQLLSQLEKTQSTTNDLINEVEQSKIENSSNNLHEESNELDQDSSKEPDQDSSNEPDQDSSKEPDKDSSKKSGQHSSKMMTREELEAELDRIALELKEEKNKNARKSYSKGELEIKVSKKGAIQINGLRKLPITIYKQEWERLFPIIDKIKQFIADHSDELTSI
jgi:hypothetical protein